MGRFGKKYTISLFALAIVSWVFWILAFKLRHWTGNEYFKYLYYPSLAIILLSAWVWIITVSSKFQPIKHLIGYPIWILNFSLFILFSAMLLEMRFLVDETVNLWKAILIAGLILFLITVWNILLGFLEGISPTLRRILQLFLTSFLLWLIPSIITFAIIIFSKSYADNFSNLAMEVLSPVSHMRNGSLVFTTILYEGIYFLSLIIKQPLKNPVNAEI